MDLIHLSNDELQAAFREEVQKYVTFVNDPNNKDLLSENNIYVSEFMGHLMREIKKRKAQPQ